MKLYDVVFTEDKVGTLKFVETSSDTNAKYKSIYLENTLSQQRYFLSKDVIRDIIKSRKDKSKETYPEIMKQVYTSADDITVSDTFGPEESELTLKQAKGDPFIDVYEFSTVGLTVDPRNYNVVLDKNHEDSDILSIAIDDSSYQLIDYESGSRIIQTGRRNGFRTCLIEVPALNSESDAILYVISLVLRPVNDYDMLVRYNLFINPQLETCGVSVYKYDIAFSDPMKYLSYNELIASNSKFFKSFKPSNVTGITTDVVLVHTKFIKNNDGDVSVPVLDNSNFVDRSAIKTIIPCDEDSLTSDDVDELLKENVLNKNLRVLTAVGVKLTSDFYKKYKVLYMYSYNPKTGISQCIKSN